MPPNPVTPGFFGKLPCRGDFLRRGLPASFVTPWDGWLSGAVAASRDRMGEAWLPAWMEAPVWRFLLPGGLCGPDGVLGLWMPSVDSVGRYFPLTLAAVFPGVAVRDDAWLAAAEESGRVALEHDAGPDALLAELAGLDAPGGEPAGAAAVWWTEGAPRVPAATLGMATMPDPDQFIAMLGGVEA